MDAQDTDDDSIFEQSVFDDVGEISKGDLVWAPLKVGDEEYMWPALVKKVISDVEVSVVMLGRPSKKSVSVTGAVIYTTNQEFEMRSSVLDKWNTAMEKVKEINEKEANGIIKTKTLPPSSGTSSDGDSMRPSRKRRREGIRTASYVEGDVVWSKYRNHPIWPAQVSDVCKQSLMINYFECGDISLKTSPKNVDHFDCKEYGSNVEAGINSTMSATFKQAYKQAYDIYAKDLAEDIEMKPFIPISLNGAFTEPQTVSPKKGKNQLVHFITRNEEMFTKIAKGTLVGHYHKHYSEVNCNLETSLFGNFARSDLEEERVLTAIRIMQTTITKRLKLPHSYGISVMLPEAITRLIMFKRQCSYAKARSMYEDEKKNYTLNRKEKLSARNALLNTPLSDEYRQERDEIRQGQLVVLRKSLRALPAKRGRKK